MSYTRLIISSIFNWNTSVYQYVGIVSPPAGSSKFVASLFIKRKLFKKRYYIQETDNEKIVSFRELSVNRRKLVEPWQRLSLVVRIGDDAVFSYASVIDNEKPTLVFGKREYIELELVKMLDDTEGLNDHSKLQIAKFLRLYKRTQDLSNNLNNIYRGSKISFNAGGNLLSEKKIKMSEDDDLILNGIINRYQVLKQFNTGIQVADVAYLDNESAYCMDYKIPIDLLFKKVIVREDTVKRIFTKLMNSCLSHKSIRISEISSKNSLYFFLISERELEINQFEIESIISSVSNLYDHYDQSVVETGIEVDKQLGNENVPEVTATAEQEEGLLEDVTSIIKRKEKHQL